MPILKTKKFLFTKRHFDKAVEMLERDDHQKWIKTYFPFQEIELELPPQSSIAFSTSQWIDPIWEEYIKLCNRVSEKPALDPWRLGFYKFFGGTDFDFIDKIEEVLVKEGAFPKSEDVIRETPPIIEPPPRGWVYLIRNQDLHKIGITKDLFRRMKELRADDKGNELVNAVKCINYQRLEKELQSLYKADGIPQTEYFRLDSSQVQEVQILMKNKAKS